MSRRRIARALDDARLLTALHAWRSAFGGPWIAVLNYHRVADGAWLGGASTPFDDGVIDTCEAELDAQLAFLARRFEPIALDDLIAFRRGERALPKNPALVTFDDGYLDNHALALPLLEKHRVPATFFVATSYVDERRLFWWDRINYVLKATARRTIALTYPGPITLTLDGEGAARGEAIAAVLRVVKHCFGLDLDRFLAHLDEAAGITLARDEERHLADGLLMTWDHLRDLRARGMDVQSHTHTHRVMNTVSGELLARELRESKAALERELRAPVRALAYPVGIALRFAPHVRAAVEEAGYELAFTDGDGINRRRQFDPLEIRRLSPDYACPDYQFRAMLAHPYFRP